MIRFFPTAGDTLGWAIDEDLRLLRAALRGAARETSLAKADVVHATYWPHLFFHHPDVLRRRFVVAHADNPPFFYLTQPGFARAQQIVDLWIARSTEAEEQFAALRLPCLHIPYAIEGSVFFPISDRRALRRKYGLPTDTYIIANFHRDSEGADVTQPKTQKAPEMMVSILRRLRDRGAKFHVLLAGPRRHWLRRNLGELGIPFTFAGRDGIEGDDYRENILSRPQLNELYNACDLYLIPSRWEGGPQSAMEAAAARTKVLSTPLGVARDILEANSLFDTASEAADKIFSDMQSGLLGATIDAQHDKVRRDHTDAAMSRHLRNLYAALPRMESYIAKASLTRNVVDDAFREISSRIRSRFAHPRVPRSVALVHRDGSDSSLDDAAANLRDVLERLGMALRDDGSSPVISTAGAPADADFRLLPPGGEVREASDKTVHVAFSVQDAVNFRRMHPRSPVVVSPLVFGPCTGRAADPHVVENGDRLASFRIWQSLVAGDVPVYPAGSPYYYQVFHGGIPYGSRRSREDAVRIAAQEKSDFVEMAVRPSPASAATFWRGLLVSA